MTPTAAPAAARLLAEATQRWPGRSRSSDGILSSAAHKLQNPRSGHDFGNAVDLTHDPEHGCDAHALAGLVMQRRDPRVRFVIARGRIWSRDRYNDGWRPYAGRNPHETHAHFELDPTRRDDTGPWFSNWKLPQPAPIFFEEDDMIPADAVVDTLACTVPGCSGWWELRADGAVETLPVGSNHAARHYFGSYLEPYMEPNRLPNVRFVALGPRRGGLGYTLWGHDGKLRRFFEFGPGIAHNGVTPVPANAAL